MGDKCLMCIRRAALESFFHFQSLQHFSINYSVVHNQDWISQLVHLLWTACGTFWYTILYEVLYEKMWLLKVVPLHKIILQLEVSQLCTKSFCFGIKALKNCYSLEVWVLILYECRWHRTHLLHPSSQITIF